MLNKILDVGFYYNAWNEIKSLFKDFKFTKIDLTKGNEMLRTSWFGRHDFVPYVRIDLWRVGYRISYDPDYCSRYFFEYKPMLTEKQNEMIKTIVDNALVHDKTTPRRTITRNGQVVSEPATLWRDVCRYIEDHDWV